MIPPIQFPSLATGSVVMTFMQIYPIERLNLASMSQMSCTCFKTTAEISRKKEGYPVTSESINSTSCSSKVRNFSRKQPRKAKCKPRRMGRILGLNIGLELLNQQTCQPANMGICLLQILPIELQTDEPISICFPFWSMGSVAWWFDSYTFCLLCIDKAFTGGHATFRSKQLHRQPETNHWDHWNTPKWWFWMLLNFFKRSNKYMLKIKAWWILGYTKAI